LFGGKAEMTLANVADVIQANKAAYKADERRFGENCDHCKKHVHKRSQCWILHPHLKPVKFMKEREARAHLSKETNEVRSSQNGGSAREGEQGFSISTHCCEELGT